MFLLPGGHHHLCTGYKEKREIINYLLLNYCHNHLIFLYLFCAVCLLKLSRGSNAHMDTRGFVHHQVLTTLSDLKFMGQLEVHFSFK